jgi:hypothetical protein
MIISHKQKLIFIKPQKTAGTSVELMLSRVCGDKDIITPLGFDPDPGVREKYKARPPQHYYRKRPLKHWQVNEIYYYLFKNMKANSNYWEHLHPELIKQYVGDEIFYSYKKISIVRNPWDQAVSHYLWQKKYGYKGGEYDFETYLEKSYVSLFPFYYVNGEYIIDEMLRFENLKADTQNLLEKLNISESLELPITKNKVRKKKNYNDFYTEETSNKIIKKNQILINQFNYRFCR